MSLTRESSWMFSAKRVPVKTGQKESGGSRPGAGLSLEEMLQHISDNHPCETQHINSHLVSHLVNQSAGQSVSQQAGPSSRLLPGHPPIQPTND